MSKAAGNVRVGTHKSGLETPVLIVDLDVMERNLRKMAGFFEGVSSNLRPHTKTHKTPALARLQIEHGAVGVCCGGLGEAEVMIEAGIRNVLVTREIVQPVQIARVASLARRSDLIVIVDTSELAERISSAGECTGARIQTMVDVMSCLERTGVPPGEKSRQLAREVNELRGLKFVGLMGYEGSMHGWKTEKRAAACRESLGTLMETKELIESDGIAVEILSAGATSTYEVAGTFPGVTEVQAGTYLTMDAEYYGFFPEFEIALSVLATVVSRPTPTTVTTDAGSKKLTTDEGLPVPKPAEGIVLKALNEEHGRLQLTDPNRVLKVGDKLEFIPSHGCTTFNLYNHLYGVRNDRVETIWEIAGRGC
jgi:D-serine deaminase-like pyridoxal phosphate-dependent protein